MGLAFRSYEYGGSDYEETYSARGQLNNGVASDIDFQELCAIDGIELKDLAMLEAPNIEDMQKLDPINVSYVEWDSYANYCFAKRRGFHDLQHEWNRSHHVENFDQIDSRAYLVHSWMKYPKFGHASATDYAARFVRYGLMTREEAVEAVRLHDAKLDNRCVRDFVEFVGYSETEFWSIVDKFYNRDLFEKNEMGEWKLKNSVWQY